MPSARVRGLCFGCHFLARPKKWRKKGAQAFPLGTPLVRAQTTRRGTAALLMFARRVKDSDFAFAFKAKCKQIGQRIFAVSFCLKFVRTGARSTWQKLLQSYLRAPSVLAIFHQIANAKAESAYSRQNIGGAVRRRFWRSPREAPEGKSGRPFFRHFFATRQRNGTKRSASACRRHRVSVRLRKN